VKRHWIARSVPGNDRMVLDCHLAFAGQQRPIGFLPLTPSMSGTDKRILNDSTDMPCQQVIQIVNHFAVYREVDSLGEIVKHDYGFKAGVFGVYGLESF
jgi:hypothetical protein